MPRIRVRQTWGRATLACVLALAFVATAGGPDAQAAATGPAVEPLIGSPGGQAASISYLEGGHDKSGDCGLSTPLDAAHTLWVLCDPAWLEGTNKHVGQISTRAGLAPPDDPGAFQPAGSGDFLPRSGQTCPSNGVPERTWAFGMDSWDDVVPGTRRGIVYFGDFCGVTFVRDGVATFQYDGTGTAPVAVRQTRPGFEFDPIWSDAGQTFGRPVHHDGFVYVFDCKTDDGCRVARISDDTPDAEFANKNSYAYYDGVTWVTDESQAADVFAPGNVIFQANVVWNEQVDRFMLTSYVPDENRALRSRGFHLWTAEAPEGPWTQATAFGASSADEAITPASCSGDCYAWYPHVKLGNPSSLWVSYADREPVGGQSGTPRMEVAEIDLCLEQAALDGAMVGRQDTCGRPISVEPVGDGEVLLVRTTATALRARTRQTSGWAAEQQIGPAAPVAVSFEGRAGVAQNADGRLELFVTGSDGKLYHSWEQTAGGRDFAAWASLGQSFAPGVAAELNANGAIEVAAGALVDGHPMHTWQAAAQPNGWAPWTPLGASQQAVATGSLSLASKFGGEGLEAFAVEPDGDMVHIWQDPNTATGWSDWTLLGGTSGTTTVARKADHWLEVFGVQVAVPGQDEQALHAWQDPSSGSGWHPIVPMPSWAGGLGNQITAFGDPGSGRLEVLATTGDGLATLHTWQDPAEPSGWAPWQELAP